MPYRICIADKTLEAEIIGRRPQLLLSIDGIAHAVAAISGGGAEIALTVDGVQYSGWRYRIKNEVHVRLNGHTSIVRFEESLSQAHGESSSQEIRSDMPGIVVALHCEPGQFVKAGDKLLTMESMKLQVTLVASHDATVERIHVAPNTVFERGVLLVSFARAENVKT